MAVPKRLSEIRSMTPGTSDSGRKPFDEGDPEHHELSAEDKAAEAEFLAHLDQLGGAHEPVQHIGEVFLADVVDVRPDGVLVDVGGKSEALLGLEEFVHVDGKPAVKVGDRVPVIQIGREGDGSPRLSHREARARRSHEVIAKAHAEKSSVKGRVTQVVKGGVMVDLGLPAFMPASQIDLFKIPDLNSLVGQELEGYVIEYDPRRRRAVISRRQMLFERREKERRSFLANLKAGDRTRGRVKSALEFGVFVDLGGVDGFIPREEVTFDRGTPPTRVVRQGEEIEVVVTNVEVDGGKITLSRRQALRDPWDNAEERYAVGSVVEGTIVSIQNYGAFVHLEEGVTGMIHASDMSWTLGSKKPEDYVKVGEVVKAQVLEVSRDKRRVSLGLKQLTSDPWHEAVASYQPGAAVKGTVTSLTSYGAFVKVNEFIEGMVHVSDITWERRLNHPKEVLKVGQEVEGKVLKIDNENRRLSIGLKQHQESPYEQYQKDHPVGTVVAGKVTRFAPFGAFVELAPGLEGLIHISQIDVARVELPEKALNAGDTVQVKILKYEPKGRKISLSRKDVLRASPGTGGESGGGEQPERPARGPRGPRGSGERGDRGPRGGGDKRRASGGANREHREILEAQNPPDKLNNLGEMLRALNAGKKQ
jgi:small subunit ribosomal protein S1